MNEFCIERTCEGACDENEEYQVCGIEQRESGSEDLFLGYYHSIH